MIVLQTVVSGYQKVHLQDRSADIPGPENYLMFRPVSAVNFFFIDVYKIRE